MFIKNILATDMKKHTDLLKDFNKEFLVDNKFTVTDHINSKTTNPDIIKKNKVEMTDDQVMLITSLFTHVADLSGPVKKYSIAYQWSKRVNQEFSNQVAEEINLN